jgi:hypothetical protein
VTRHRRGFRGLVIAALVAMLVGTTNSMAAASTAEGVSPVLPACAWRYQVGPTTLNAAFPDSNALYWITSFKVQPALSIVVKGQFATARYSSLTVYNAKFSPFATNGITSELTDFQIAPNHGSTNPWRKKTQTGGHYTVTLSSSPDSAHANALPIAPAAAREGSMGYLVYRVYLPASGDQSLRLPALTFRLGSKSTAISRCTSTTSPTAVSGNMAAAPPPPPGAGSTTGVLRRFSRNTSSMGSLFPNPDNGYLAAQVAPPTGDDVVVVRGKAPTTPGGYRPAPWPSSAQVRYFSLCTYVPVLPFPVVANPLPDGTVDNGCRSDAQTSVDKKGYYAYVLGTESQRAAIKAIPGVTFVPFSSKYPTRATLVSLRHLIGNYPEAVQQVPPNFNPDTAAAVMGDYYPVITTCALATLASGGPAACRAPAPAS